MVLKYLGLCENHKVFIKYLMSPRTTELVICLLVTVHKAYRISSKVLQQWQHSRFQKTHSKTVLLESGCS